MGNVEEDSCMPIAVIGMGCRFPGDATSPDHLWELLENGRSAWSEFPKDRINVDGFYHPSGERQGSICFKGGHFLRDDVAAFDAPFFSTTAHEAAAMDPQQRILLEVSYEAFENAGIPIETLPRSSTAVYCGSFVKDYEQICLRDPDDSPQYAATGNGIAIMSNRISWFYDLRGPSMTLDTGCSASLVGVHLACQSLRTGESTLAMAMGAGLILTPATMLPMTALNFLSPDGKCFAFDERANGYGRGEGIGAVILKPLAAALRDNDTIRAVIRGSGVNQDGRTPGITMPSKEAQAINIRAVYKAAGLGYDRTAYFEAHGTGTQAGDPTELGAISETFAETRPKDEPIYVGSVKTNIGHLEGCAGVAGLIKGVLMLEKGMIPTNLYFENVNPRIPMDEWKIKVPKSLTPWPMDGLRRVSINCFGFGGTNAHIILDDAFHYMAERGILGNHASADLSQPSSPTTTDSGVDLSRPPTEEGPSWLSPTPKQVQLYALTAHEESGIVRLASAYAEYLGKQNFSEICERDIFKISSNLAYTLGNRRTKLSWKAFVVSGTPAELSAQLLNDLSKPRRSSEEPVIAFAFSGQGAQWPRMGRELLQFQVFQDSLEAAEKYLQSLGCEWSLIAELLKDEARSLINLPRISQPLCTALQIALVDLLKFWGVTPRYVVGHSSGEIAAAYASHAISRQDAWKLAYHRGRLTSAMKYLAPTLKGRMMAVALSAERANDYLSVLREGTAIVACINSPESVTISGDEAAVLELEKLLQYEGIFARLLKVDNAYHSSHMKIIERHYLQSISGVTTLESQDGRIMFSSVTGKVIRPDELQPSYWARNLISPVRFSQALSSLLQSKRSKLEVIIEIGPHGVLQGPIKQIMDAKSKLKSKPTYLSMIYRGKDAVSTSLEAAGNLWSLGCILDLERVNSNSSYKPKVLTDLPTYPWNHTKTYWHESHLGSSHRFRKWGRQDLIGAQTADSISGEPRWRGFIRVSENPWVEDHQVQNTIIYPAAGMISMALEAARQVQDTTLEIDGYEISKMHIEKAMIVPTTAHGLETALNAKIQQSNTSRELGDHKTFDFTIYSKPKGANWVEHAHGLMTIRYKAASRSEVDVENDHTSSEEYRSTYFKCRETCTENVPPRQLYETLESIGMKYGPTFQNITSVQKKDNSSITTVKIPDTASRMPAKYEYPHLIHPATLDAMFQTVFVAGNEPMVPSYLESLFISAQFPIGAGKELEGYSSASRYGLRDALGTIVMSDSLWKKPLLIVKNLHFTALSSSPADAAENGFLPNHHKLCAELTWNEDVDTTKAASFQQWLQLLAFKKLDLNILEVNTDSTLLMEHVLAAIGSTSESTPRMANYVVASPDSTQFEATQINLSQWPGQLSWKKLDSAEDILNQGFKMKQFDLILIRPTELKWETSLSTLLKPGGRLLEVTDPGVSDEHTNVADVDLSQYQMINQVESEPSNSSNLAEDASLPKRGSSQELTQRGEIGSFKILSSLPILESLISREVALIMPEIPSTALKSLSSKVIDALFLIGVTAATTEFSDSSDGLAGKICISLLEIECPIIFNLTQEHFDAFRSMIKIAKGCLWITSGGHVDSSNPFSSPASTLCKTIRSEDPQRLIYTLDLDPASRIDSDEVGRVILLTILKSFRTGNLSEEMEYAERVGKLLISRVQLQTQLSSRIERGDAKPHPRLLPCSQPGRPLHLEIGTLGDLNSLCFNDDGHAEMPINPDDVEIEVAAVGVKMPDVKTAMGQTSNDTLGTDVTGIVKRVGRNVSKFKIGDRIVTVVGGAYKSFVRAAESMCQLIPAKMDLDTTASLPGDLMLAYYSLITVGRLQKDEFVLIHDAASAFGQIAIQMARAIGAEIFTTVTNEKDRDFLVRSAGIMGTQILDAASSQLSSTIRRLTDGHGADLVLNTLPREKLGHTWAAINSFGRFVELGGNEGSALTDCSTSQDLRNVTYSRVDLDAIIKQNVSLASRLLNSAFKFVRDGKVKEAHGLSVRPVAEITKAFREVQAGAHVVLKMYSNDLVPIVPRDEHPLRLEAEATYVLVGGLGGLGRSLAALMVLHEARNLAFLSRSGAVSEDQIQFINSLAKQGVQGRVYKCDICVKSQLEDTIRKCEKEMPRIRGVIQAAAVIRDAIFDNMTYEDWVVATQPKMQGSWNLHESMPDDLDFFVFLSSSAAVIGARGQANYASGNAFQDALAQYRRGKGQAAVSLDLGPILGVGMVAEDDATADILRAGGFFGVREKDFHHLVSAAMTNFTEDGTRTPSQVIIATGTGGLVKQNQVSDPYWYREARFSHMRFVDLAPQSSNSTDEVSMQELLTACTSLTEAASIILEGLTILLAKSMNMLPGDLDTRKAASAYGVDSLVAVGTRNWIFRETGVDVSVFEILSEVAIEELAAQIAGKCRFLAAELLVEEEEDAE